MMKHSAGKTSSRKNTLRYTHHSTSASSAAHSRSGMKPVLPRGGTTMQRKRSVHVKRRETKQITSSSSPTSTSSVRRRRYRLRRRHAERDEVGRISKLSRDNAPKATVGRSSRKGGKGSAQEERLANVRKATVDSDISEHNGRARDSPRTFLRRSSGTRKEKMENDSQQPAVYKQFSFSSASRQGCRETASKANREGRGAPSTPYRQGEKATYKADGKVPAPDGRHEEQARQGCVEYRRFHATVSEVSHSGDQSSTMNKYVSLECLASRHGTTTALGDLGKDPGIYRTYSGSVETSFDSHVGRQQVCQAKSKVRESLRYPLRADSAASPVLILRGVLSPQRVRSYSQQRGNETARLSVEESSGDTSPPLEKKQLRFSSPPVPQESGRHWKDYKQLIKSEEMHRARPTKLHTEVSRSDMRYDEVSHWIETGRTWPIDDDRKHASAGKNGQRFTFSKRDLSDHSRRTRLPASHTTEHAPRGGRDKNALPSERREPVREEPCRKAKWPLTGDHDEGGSPCRSISRQEQFRVSKIDREQNVRRAEPSLKAPDRRGPPSVKTRYVQSIESRSFSFNVKKPSVTPSGFEGDVQSLFYSCGVGQDQLESGAGDSEARDDLRETSWSPLSNALPPMVQKTLEDRQKALRCIRRENYYGNDMALLHKLQNASCHNLMLIGGISFNQPAEYLDGSAMLLYHPGQDAWFFIGTMPEPRCFHAAVLVGNDVIVTGGLDPLAVDDMGKMRSSNKTFRFNLRSLAWRTVSNMVHERAYHVAVSLEEKVYVFGGKDNSNKIIPSAEVYSTKNDQWRLIHPMPKPMMGVGATALNGKIWLVGGIKGSRCGRRVLQSAVYSFDPKADSWCPGTPMLQSRAFCSAVTVSKEIWVVGGIVDVQGMQCTSRIDVFDPAKGSWERRDDLACPIHSVRITKAGPLVYFVGGQTSDNKLSSDVSCFDRRKGVFHNAMAQQPRAVAGSTALGIPKDRMALRSRPWPAIDATKLERWNAAVTIQRAFRLYLKAGTLKKMPLRRRSRLSASARPSSLLPEASNHWAAVHIEKWPPSITSSFDLDSITGDGALDRDNYVHYATLSRRMDPNLGLIDRMDDSFLKTKKVLGLRMTPDTLWKDIGRMRKARSVNDPADPVILVLGGLNPRSPLCRGIGSAVLKLRPLRNRWSYVNSVPEPRCYHAAVYIRNKVFVIGGYSYFVRRCGEMVACRTMYCLDVPAKKWERAPDMSSPRACHSAVVADDGCIYVFGGRGHHGRLLSSVEKYDTNNRRWETRASMAEPRMGMAAVFFSGSAWLLGGIADDRVLADVITYTPGTNCWNTCRALRVPRAYASAVVLGEELWLCGGCRHDGAGLPVSMSSVDVLCPASAGACWRRVCTMDVARHSAAAVALGLCLYVMGGVNSDQWCSISKTSVLFTERGAITVASELPVPVTGHAAVVIPADHPRKLPSRWNEAL
ncbi:beta-scruin-like isoform X2 [Ornithodoros turicata]